MTPYPEKLISLIDRPQYAGTIDGASVTAISADFECGTAITFDLVIDSDTKYIESIRYRTNGCGYMIAAGESIAAAFEKRELTNIGGFDGAGPTDALSGVTGELSPERGHCISTAADAFKKALAKYREKAAAAYNGDSPLVCSCYGISEADVNETIKMNNVESIDSFMKFSRAGAGCGSCRMVIEELIDTQYADSGMF